MVGAVVKGALRRAFSWFGLEIRRRRAHQGVAEVEDVGLSHVLEILFRCVDDLRFVQVGANDGVQHDLLHALLERSDPRGILIEPQAVPFQKLQARYGGRARLTLLQAAIDRRAGTRTLYRCREDLAVGAAAAVLSGLASFDRAQVVKAYARHARRLGLSEHPDRAIVGAAVPTLTLDAILNDFGFDRCDLLVIDTEGHDFEIIRTIDFSRIRPLVLIYEHKHLGPADRLACWRLLRANGYRCAADWSNTLALLAGESASMASAANGASRRFCPSSARQLAAAAPRPSNALAQQLSRRQNPA
ncbi:MAG: FkbM family methyltransferase, partial [Geminicoccaceae bacterium]